MNVIGEEALDMYETLEWDADGDENVLKNSLKNLLIHPELNHSSPVASA